MKLTPRVLNIFMITKLPAAYLCGVRAKSLTETTCVATIKYNWINSNPFKSIYFAVLSMAAELSTGALMISKIRSSGHDISMLVTANKSTFTKKAVGMITFTCNDGAMVSKAIQTAMDTKESQQIVLTSIGVDAKGEQVCEMDFEWSIKIRI